MLFCFEDRPSCKEYSPSKGFSPWEVLSLVQKIKMAKTCEKPFYILKIGYRAMAIAHTKSMVHAKCSVRVQILKCEKHAKKPLHKEIKK